MVIGIHIAYWNSFGCVISLMGSDLSDVVKGSCCYGGRLSTFFGVYEAERNL